MLLAAALAGCALSTGAAVGHPAARASRASRAPRAVPTRPPLRAYRPTTVVGLGDSVMAGSACGCAGPVAEYARVVGRRSGQRVVDINLGRNGATTSTLLSRLHQRGAGRDVMRARVVLVIIGANDLLPQRRRWEDSGCPPSCYAPAVAAMGRRIRRVLTRVRTLRAHSRGTVLVADYWNVFKDGKVARNDGGQPLIAWSRRVSRAANRAICRAARGEDATCVDTYTAFVGNDRDPTGLLADDGDHPNPKGVALLVRQLVRATPAGEFR